jgi:hypothetical protein
VGFDNFDWNNPRANGQALSIEGTSDAALTILRWVYMWMGLGLLTTAVVAWITATTPALASFALSGVGMIGSIVLSFGLVIALSAAINRLSPLAAGGMFFAYAVVLGFMLSSIFMVYQIGTISTAFFSTAIMFAIMTLVGFTTKIDLTKFGSFFMMALIGFIVASLLNAFIFRSGPFDVIISLVGILIFVGLTAYDTQKIKHMAADPAIQADSEMATKLSIIGALGLYLNFINIFLLLLRLLGGRD